MGAAVGLGNYSWILQCIVTGTQSHIELTRYGSPVFLTQLLYYNFLSWSCLLTSRTFFLIERATLSLSTIKVHSKVFVSLFFERLRRDVLLLQGKNEEGDAAHLCLLHIVSGVTESLKTDSSLCFLLSRYCYRFILLLNPPFKSTVSWDSERYRSLLPFSHPPFC